MPTYEYVCQKCGHEFEAFQPMKDAPLKKCPECGKAGLKRLVGSGAGIIFKGSGFYSTDYKKKGGEKKEAGGETKSGETKSGETKSGETKPADKKTTSESKPASDSKSGGGKSDSSSSKK